MLEVVFRIECIEGRHFLCFCLFYSRSWVTRNLSLDVTQDASWFSRGLLCRESCWLCCLREIPSCLSRHSLSSSTSFLFPDFLFSSWSLILSSGLRLSSSVERIPWLSRCTWTLSSFLDREATFMWLPLNILSVTSRDERGRKEERRKWAYTFSLLPTLKISVES